MVKGTTKFPVEKPYVKVQRDSMSENCLSFGKPDLLSYSYSCVQEFEKNQHIIGGLANLHQHSHFQGQTHEPRLYTLSGERENPVCQPFYSSTASDTKDLFETSDLPNFRFDYIKLLHNSRNNTPCDSEPSFDKNLLIQWFKYQLKYVNLWWPFSKSKEYFFTRLCKKEKTMKMEMMLNHVDEETKDKIKRYVTKLNLSLEERYDLCNESIIEIDITPIFSDNNRLQNFLSFLNNIESSVPKKHNVNLQSTRNSNLLGNKSITLKGNVFENHVMEGNSLLQSNDMCQQNDKKLKNGKGNYFNKINKDGNERLLNTHEMLNNAYNQNKNKTINIKNSSDTFNKTKPSHANFSLKKKQLRVDIKSNQENVKNPNQINAHIRNNNITNAGNISQPSKGQEKPTMSPCDDMIYSGNSYQNNEITFCGSQINKTMSCKCLIHQQREDYHRYRNQCLYGRGDETTNNLINYVANENQCLLSKHVITEETTENLKFNSVVEKTKAISNGNSLINGNIKSTGDFVKTPLNNWATNHLCTKHCVGNNYINNKNKLMKPELTEHLKSLGDISDSVTCDSFVDNLCFNNGNCKMVHIKDVERLVCAIDYSKENSVSKKINISNHSDEIDNENKQVPYNTCFESLNYSINSINWNRLSKTLSSSTESKSSSKRISYIYVKPNADKNLKDSKRKQDDRHISDFEIKNNNLYTSQQDWEIGKNIHVKKVHCALEDYNNSKQLLGLKELYKDATNYQFLGQGIQQITKDLTNRKVTPSSNSLDENFKQKISLFINNVNELQVKMEDLSKQLGLAPNNSEQHNRMNVNLKTKSVNNKKKSSRTQVKVSRINPISLNPKNIYKSISSIFKGTTNSSSDSSKATCQEYQTILQTQKSNEEENNKNICQKEINNTFTQTKNTGSDSFNRSSNCSRAVGPDQIDWLIFNSLEKLYTELKSQRDEIEVMKNILLNNEILNIH